MKMFSSVFLEFSLGTIKKESLEKCLRNNNKNQHENNTHIFIVVFFCFLCCEKGKELRVWENWEVRKIIFPINVN